MLLIESFEEFFFFRIELNRFLHALRSFLNRNDLFHFRLPEPPFLFPFSFPFLYLFLLVFLNPAHLFPVVVLEGLDLVPLELGVKRFPEGNVQFRVDQHEVVLVLRRRVGHRLEPLRLRRFHAYFLGRSVRVLNRVHQSN